MVSRKIVNGKHPLTVRVTEEEYAAIKAAAYSLDVSPTEFLARAGYEKALETLSEKAH